MVNLSYMFSNNKELLGRGGNDNVSQKVRDCADSLKIWGKEITSCFGKRIKECKVILKSLRNKRDDQSIAEYENFKKQLHLVLDQK